MDQKYTTFFEKPNNITNIFKINHMLLYFSYVNFLTGMGFLECFSYALIM
jgi:hypothetical protein